MVFKNDKEVTDESKPAKKDYLWLQVACEGDERSLKVEFLKGEELVLETIKWHEPVLNPQRLLHNSYGNYSPKSGAFGKVRSGGAKSHAGVDIFAPIGTAVYACLKGEIVSAKYRGSTSKKGYGNTIVIKVKKEELKAARNDYVLKYNGEQEKGPFFGDGKDRYLLYAHLNTMNVKAGDKVLSGEKIGTSGKTGNASTIKHASNRHLHFEILDKNDTSNYYKMHNRENAAYYINFITADKKLQKNNKD